MRVSHHIENPDNPEAKETLNYLKGAAKGKKLANYGLNEADLKQMRIRYCPCYGGRKEADEFFKALHECGAGNFIGDAKTEINSILEEDVGKVNHIKSKYALWKIYTKALEKIVDFSKEEPKFKINQKPLDEETLETYQNRKKYIAHIESGSLYMQTSLKRGDSSIQIEMKDDPHVDEINRLPRETDPKTGHYLYNPHYLAPVKTATSRVEKTSDPKRIEAFRNQNNKQARKTNRKSKGGGCTIS